MRNGKGSAMVVVAVAFSIAVWAPFGTAGVEAEPDGSHCSNERFEEATGARSMGRFPLARALCCSGALL